MPGAYAPEKVTAIDAFVVATHLASLCSEAIHEHLTSHMEVDPDRVNWAHVGDANKLLSDLREVCRFLRITPPEVALACGEEV